MKIGALRDSFDFFHNSGRNLLIVGLIALAACACANLIIEDDLFALYYGGLVVLGIVALVAILKNWRAGVYGFVAWIAVEDLIRKYLGNNMLVYFAKDFIALALYLSFFVACRSTLKKFYRPPFLIPFLVFFWYCVIQALNPASTSIFYGLMGLKLCFLYAPLLLVGYTLVDSEKELRRFFFFNSVLILVARLWRVPVNAQADWSLARVRNGWHCGRGFSDGGFAWRLPLDSRNLHRRCSCLRLGCILDWGTAKPRNASHSEGGGFRRHSPNHSCRHIPNRSQ